MATIIRDLLTANEAAVELGIEPANVRRYCILGRIRGRKCGVMWLIERKEVMRFKRIPRGPGNPNFKRLKKV